MCECAYIIAGKWQVLIDFARHFGIIKKWVYKDKVTCAVYVYEVFLATNLTFCLVSTQTEAKYGKKNVK